MVETVELVERTLILERDDGEMSTFVVRPASQQTSDLPGVLLLPDAWGMRDEVRDFARRVACEGYVVGMPDLYYALSGWDSDSASRKEMLAAKDSLDPARVAADATVVLAELRKEEGVKGRVGLVAFCMSGRFAIWTLAAQPAEFACASIFYGTDMLEGGPDRLREKLNLVDAELLMFFGDSDPWVDSAEIDGIVEVLEERSCASEVRVVPGASHAFAHPRGLHYQPEAAEDAWARTFVLLDSHLGR